MAHAVQYSLKPDRRRAVAQEIKKKRLTHDKLRSIAKREGVASKTIHTLASQLGVEIIAQREYAETFFKAPAPQPEPKPEPTPEPPVDSFEDLVELEKQLRADVENAFAEIVSLEEELQKAREKSARDAKRYQEAMHKTSELRRSTRQDREQIETLSGEMTVMKRKYARLRNHAKEQADTIKALAEDNRRLLKTLKKSEEDYAELIGRGGGN